MRLGLAKPICICLRDARDNDFIDSLYKSNSSSSEPLTTFDLDKPICVCLRNARHDDFRGSIEDF